MIRASLRQVWEENFKKEQDFIRMVVVQHNYVTVASRVIPLPSADSALSSFCSSSDDEAAPPPTLDETYASFRPLPNVVTLFQLGLTFSDEGGNLPKDPVTGEGCAWEFNLKVAKSMEEIDDSFRQHLTERGVDVDFNMKHAIHPDVFCLGFWCMDTLMEERIRWVVFHGCAAFGPLLHTLRVEKQLPEGREEFLNMVNLYFPKFYEVRQLMAACGLSGSTLEEVAKELGTAVRKGETTGMFNQAGPDSLLTLHVFLGIRHRHFREGIPEERANKIFHMS